MAVAAGHGGVKLLVCIIVKIRFFTLNMETVFSGGFGILWTCLEDDFFRPLDRSGIYIHTIN